MADSRPTVQRTLVKSPPELWADLSDPESLARRLGEFGEIRIIRLEPEKTVVWEGERASGTVEIESSGWGTKVRLSASATAPDPNQAADQEDEMEREAVIEAALSAEIEREAAIEAALRAEIRAEAEAEAAVAAAALRAKAEPTSQDPAPAPSRATAEPVDPARGFFARFRRRRPHEPIAPLPPAQATVTPEATPPPAAIPPTPTDEPSAPATPAFPARPAQRPPVRLSALAVAPAHPNGRAQTLSRMGAEFDEPDAETITASRRPRSETTHSKPPLDDEQTLSVLASVLDDLGAAHHRPFSRE